MTNPLDVEGVDTEDPYCPAVPGMDAHDYQPLVDLLGGTGLWLFCTQCGDYFPIDGTAPQPGTAPTVPGSISGNGNSAPSGAPWPLGSQP